ncbi:C2 NT-type domain-containing protein [Abeliophyllum distichum]|uniref:C2 NT-type domain-containing protein n=1 Tax=Abeliophyllum distichum TaxID=126358 RepID=A0ABD1SIV9_9LAMI
MRTKNRKSPSVQLDYTIYIQEIKPWPPSQSLRTLRSVLIQWEHGNRNSGFTNQVVPSLGTGSSLADGRIEFNESFRLPVTLLREMSIKSGNGDTFQKNCLEFNLYEPRSNKMVKGQLLGTAVVDLAEYGVVEESLSINAPINCKRTYKNTAQPLLFLKILPVKRRETSMDRNHSDSVSAMTSEEYTEEAELASFTDDDVSSHSSLTVSSSVVDTNGCSPHHKVNRTVGANGSAVRDSKHNIAKSDKEQATESHLNLIERSSCSSSIDLSSNLSWISKKIAAQTLESCSTEASEREQNSNIRSHNHEKQSGNIQVNNVASDMKIERHSKGRIFTGTITKETRTNLDPQEDDNLEFVESHFISHGGDVVSPLSIKGPRCFRRNTVTRNGSKKAETTEKHQEYAQEAEIAEENVNNIEDDPLNSSSQDDVPKQVSVGNGVLSSSKENLMVKSNFSNTHDRSNHGKSVQSTTDLYRTNRSVQGNQYFVTDNDIDRDSISRKLKDDKMSSKESRNHFSESRIHHLEHRIKMLEGELREAAAMEVSLYSVVAEHGSSMTKVHAPARRISRLYLHACKQNSKSRAGSVAKSAASGLLLVAKACGNDVPRLTFWLSNSIVLRAIISNSFGKSQLPVSVGPDNGKVGYRNGNKKPSALIWGSIPTKGTRIASEGSFNNWENPLTFAAALERVEAWIFSRIIESIWWQTFTPHMQSGAANAIRRNMNSDISRLHRKTSSSAYQEQGYFSLELWKRAFRDACERICPVRAAGHECGCLHMLSRMIMEQCIARLDVSMFNAILRKSADEIPTDPVSDPISDSEVLPIKAGKASFGSGVQLKNAIGNWSRWLTDLCGIDDDDSCKDETGQDNAVDDGRNDTSFKSFHLLNALSDLMMLPKDMLLDRTIRKEVCPTFGPALIRRVLDSFIPDEFCPDSVPGVVLDALNSEDPLEAEEDSFINFPCAAVPIEYMPPSVSSVAVILREFGSRSSVLKKSYTSDDELDELNSPLRSIIIDSFHSSHSPAKPDWTSKESGCRNAVRYQLLREVWMNSE